jgi:ribonuclease P protein component
VPDSNVPATDARLRSKTDFDRVFAGGRRRQSRFFRYTSLESLAGCARLGMAVSRRVDKRAVVRNRLRRQIRESFRAARLQLPPLDIVVTAKAEAAAADRVEVWQDLVRFWASLAPGK